MKGPFAPTLSGLVPLLALVACGSTTAPAPRVSVGTASAPPVASSAPPAEVVTPAPRKSDRFAIATENDAALSAAAAALDRGGNAVDAAVAGVLTGGVAQPSSTGLGADGFAVVWDAGSKTAYAVEFRAKAPKGLKRKDHLARATSKKKRGVMVGVPGLVAGLRAMHERSGKLTWADDVAPAIDAAEQGFVVSPYVAESLAWLAKDEDVDADFSIGAPKSGAPLTAPPPEGTVLVNARLAQTLRAIAKGGSAAFYTGDVAKDVVATARAAGSALTEADLASYEATVRDPLRTQWEGLLVLGAAPPSAGGVTVAELLGLFSKPDLGALGLDSALYVHFVAEGLRATLVDRQTYLGDPAFTKMDAASLLDRARLDAKRGSFRKDATTMPKLRSIAEGGTFHLSVIDDAGNAVSITTTLTDLFGAKLSTRAGFPLNDALTDFTMDEYGQRPTNRGPNFPRGGAKPTSSLAPTIVVRDGVAVLALGASGGLRAPTSVAEVLFARLAFDRPLADAIAHPRFYVPSTGALLLDGGLAPLAEDLRARGEIVDAKRADFSAVSAVERADVDGVRVLSASGDPRKHGVSLVRGGADASPATSPRSTP